MGRDASSKKESNLKTLAPYPLTATIELTNATSTYVLALAEKGWKKAIADDSALRKGLNVCEGKVTCRPVADAFGLKYLEIKL